MLGSVVHIGAAFIAWAWWDETAWGFGTVAPQAGIVALGAAAAIAVGIWLRRDRVKSGAIFAMVVGISSIVLAADLVARSRGAWLLGELDGIQASGGGGESSLAPAAALAAAGAIIVAVTASARRAATHVQHQPTGGGV